MARITVNGVDLYYEWHGPEGAPVLVLSNGILANTQSWVYQKPVLSRFFRLLLYDCRGQGQSEHPPGPYSMEQHADDLAALLTALGVRRAHVGGISYGAEISLMVGYRYPELVRTLVICSAVSHVDPLLQAIIQRWKIAARSRDGETFFWLTHTDNFSSGWIARHQDFLQSSISRYQALDFTAVEWLLDSFLGLNITGELHRIPAPTLVICGEQDILKPRTYAERIVREIPQAEFVLIPECGHVVIWEKPDIFNSLVLGFLLKQGD
jgi:3-oxoadipate enol-lactonase